VELNIKDILRILVKRAWIVITLVLLFSMGAGYYTDRYVEPVYDASTKIIVNKIRETQGVRELNWNDLNANIQLISTYKEIIKTPWVMEEVVKEHPEFGLTVNQLSEMVKVSSVNDTQVMTLTALSTSYPLAAEVVNAVTEKFVQKIPGLMQIDNVEILTRANPDERPSPIKPNPKLNIVIAGVLAAMLGIGLSFLLEVLDSSVGSDEEVEQLLNLPILTVIGKMKRVDYRPKKIKNTLDKESIEATVTEINNKVTATGNGGEQAYATSQQ
jgi:capsular polysaccharide biosynthesis protein